MYRITRSFSIESFSWLSAPFVQTKPTLPYFCSSFLRMTSNRACSVCQFYFYNNVTRCGDLAPFGHFLESLGHIFSWDLCPVGQNSYLNVAIFCAALIILVLNQFYPIISWATQPAAFYDRFILQRKNFESLSGWKWFKWSVRRTSRKSFSYLASSTWVEMSSIFERSVFLLD